MPKVSIREIDTTGGEQLEFLNYTVVIPGPALADKDKTYLAAGLLTSTAQLKGFNRVKEVDPTDFDYDAIISEADSEKFLSQDLGFIMIKELLNRGLTVYYVPAYGQTKPEQNASFSFSPERLEDFAQAEWPDNEGEASSNPFKLLKIDDRGFCDVRFITLGGLNQIEDEITTEIQKCALECAGNRGDAVALLDTPTKDEENNDLADADAIDEWIQETFQTIASTKII